MPEILLPHIWWIAAILVSFVKVGFMLTSQYMKIDGTLTIFWRGLIPFLALSPFLLYIELPSSWIFYGATLTTALIVSYTDIKAMNGAIKYGAGVVLRLLPFSLWGLFLSWVILSPDYREHFFGNPMMAMGITIAISCAAIGSSFMRKCEVSKDAFMYFLPVLFCSVAVDIFNKTAMDSSPVLGGIIVYAWLQGGVITVSCMLRQRFLHKEPLSKFFQNKVLIAGGIIGIGFVFANILKNTAMTFTINPAYVTAIILISPIWTSIFYRLKGEKEQANELAGLLVVASSIMLVLFASNM